jgi:hypothetical protein
MGGPIYSRHARKRMALRGISEQDVEFILRHPHTEYPDRDGNRVLVGDRGGRQLKVIVAQDSDPQFVITTAWRE